MCWVTELSMHTRGWTTQNDGQSVFAELRVRGLTHPGSPRLFLFRVFRGSNPSSLRSSKKCKSEGVCPSLIPTGTVLRRSGRCQNGNETFGRGRSGSGNHSHNEAGSGNLCTTKVATHFLPIPIFKKKVRCGFRGSICRFNDNRDFSHISDRAG